MGTFFVLFPARQPQLPERLLNNGQYRCAIGQKPDGRTETPVHLYKSMAQRTMGSRRVSQCFSLSSSETTCARRCW